MKNKVELGIIVITKGIEQAMNEEPKMYKDIVTALTRHQSGDWG